MNKPTNAEIKDLYAQETGFTLDDSPAALLDFARAVLAKWGQPAHSGEPVAWKHDCAALLMNDVELWIDACPHCGKPRNAPQPAPQQEAQEPVWDGKQSDAMQNALEAAAKPESGEPYLWVSPEQAANIADHPPGEGGRYLPVRKSCDGKFTEPLYRRPPKPQSYLRERSQRSDCRA